MDTLSEINSMRKMMAGLKEQKYALIKPEMLKFDEYIRELYIKILCTIAQYENSPTNMQELFLKRIVNGMKVEHSVEECIHKAMKISEEDVQVFFHIIGTDKAKYYFILDALLLLSMGKPKPGCQEYVAEIIELLDINKSDLVYITRVAIAIIEQKSALYDDAKIYVNDRVIELDFKSYIHNFYVGAIVDTELLLHYFVHDKEMSKEISFPNKYKNRKIVFENLYIEISREWQFEGCSEVIFKECHITGHGNGKLLFNGVRNIEIQKCHIRGFSNRFAYLEVVNNLCVENTEFLDCGLIDKDHQWAEGGIFFINNPLESISVRNNVFSACYVVSKNSYQNRGILMGSRQNLGCKKIVLDNNLFGGCFGKPNAMPSIFGSMSSKEGILENNSVGGLELGLRLPMA